MAILIRAVMLLLLIVSAVAAENVELAEKKIKVGMLYNFLKYTNWPSAAESPHIIVCVFGADPFAGSLQPMQGRSVNQREITLRSIKNISEASGCNLLFVNGSEKENWPKLRDVLARKAVLTVSDFEGFGESGGMIEFTLSNNHVEAKLNVEALRAGQLNVEPRLLKLVTIMRAGRSG